MSPYQIRLPDLLSVLPQGRRLKDRPTNPNFAQLDANFSSWVTNSAPLPPKQKKTILQAQMPYLVALVYPDASLSQLTVCLRYMLLSLVLENLTDNASTDQCRAWTDMFVGLLKGEKLDEKSSQAKHPMYQFMAGLSAHVMKEISDTHRHAFISENEAAAESIVKEALDREISSSDNGCTTSLAEYMDHRQATIGLRPFLVLERWVRGIDLPDTIFHHPVVKAMVDAAVEMVFIANDIYSYKKECIAGEASHNIITVIMHDNCAGVSKGDIQGAFDVAFSMFRGAWAQFVQAKEYLDEDENYGALTEAYSAALLDCVAGNIHWSLICDRYSVFEDEKSRVCRLISIQV
ncbi:hypothetical protein HGRIS_013719 [Hohenbuehelia grisea]|uniref:Terpene synthase n=1 Tax=Hohenbuehelia grisea TaxID=104357 RepID=A0ABR3IWF5_9AGAR